MAASRIHSDIALETKTDSSRKRNIIFLGHIYPDGLGDMGHFVDMASPDHLDHLVESKQIPFSFGSAADQYQPIYTLADKPFAEIMESKRKGRASPS